MNTTNAPAAYSPREAAKVCGIGLTTLYAERNAGRLRMLKVGRRSLVTVDAIQAWLAALPVDGQRIAA